MGHYEYELIWLLEITIKLKERPAQCETNVHDTVTGVASTENTCNWKRPCS